jgi:predicted dehydrogenase
LKQEDTLTKTINVGIIGLGYIGKVHAQAYRTIPLAFPDAPMNAHLKAVWRTSLGRDEAFIRSCGFETQTTDLEEFFNQPLDLVDICTPTGLHTEYVRRAAERGMAIYCEKPLGKDLADARLMTSYADHL